MENGDEAHRRFPAWAYSAQRADRHLRSLKASHSAASGHNSGFCTAMVQSGGMKDDCSDHKQVQHNLAGWLEFSLIKDSDCILWRSPAMCCPVLPTRRIIQTDVRASV